MIRALLYVLFLLVAVRAVYRLLKGIVRGAVGPASGASPGAAPPVRMVQDPVCGTFVVPGKAVGLTRAGHTVYFCSDECRDRYAGS